MAIRYLKIVLVAFVALLAPIYAGQNVVNLDKVYTYVATVTSMEGHALYPDALGPAITNPVAIWTIVTVIIAAEFAAGLLALKGTYDLWRARKAPAKDFNAAKTYGILGCGMALVVWFGIFAVIGGAWFQMWQTELGQASLEGAFQYVGNVGLVLIFLAMKDE